MLVIKVSMFT